MPLDTTHLEKCATTLEQAMEMLAQHKQAMEPVLYEVFRNAAIKSFELCLETAGKLLRKRLKDFTGAPREVDSLTYREVFRHAARHGIVSPEEAERWFEYRASRNTTAHDYGEPFVEELLPKLPVFLDDARALAGRLKDGER